MPEQQHPSPETRALIAGDWRDAADGSTFPVRNPATDEVIAQVADCSSNETTDAIDAAHRAAKEWADTMPEERSRLLSSLAARMREQTDHLAQLMTREQGKPLHEARGEIAYAASFLDHAAGEPARIIGDIVPASAKGKHILVHRRPVGVTAIITPWNFPSAMITRKLGPALAAGCTTVIKPAEDTPLSALAIGQIAREVGIPPGVVNIVTGKPEPIARVMLEDPRVRKITFTGSTAVGRSLMRSAADNLLRVSLELGGHAPFIVFDDADLDRAVAGAMACKFRNAGQTCICANRFYIQSDIHDAFVERLADAMGSLVVGDGMSPGTSIGPLIRDDALEKAERHIADALDHGATCLTGGRRASIPNLADRFLQPTLLVGMTPEMLIAREETFAPVAAVSRFDTEEQAIELANSTEYGLAAYFYTRDPARTFRVAKALEFGIVGANDALPSTAQAPFGGMKHSGIGREGGHYAIDEYTERQYLAWQP